MHLNGKILQKYALRVAGRIFRTGNLAHAWLLAGQEGTGKEELARRMASLLMCETPLIDQEYPEPCTGCSHCGKLSRGTHPDINVIQPDGAFIKLPQVHELQKNISYSPLEARNRAVLLLHSHKMNREAANALLKTLEEPPDRTFLILTASSVNALLPTIVSRCQVISCAGLDTGDIVDALLREMDIDASRAELAARLSDGSLARARVMLDQGCKFRDLFMRFITLPAARRFSLLTDVSKAMSSNVEDFMSAISVIRAVVRDLLVIKTNGHGGLNPENAASVQLMNSDVAGALESAAAGFSVDKLSDYACRLEDMERLAGRNINRKMLANALLVFWVS